MTRRTFEKNIVGTLLFSNHYNNRFITVNHRHYCSKNYDIRQQSLLFCRKKVQMIIMVLRSQKEKEKKYFDEVSQFLREKIKNTKHNKLTSFCFFEGRIVLYNQGSKIWWPD